MTGAQRSRNAPAVGRSLAFLLVGLAAGFAGLAVLASILTPVPLLLAEAATIAVATILLGVVIRRAPRPLVRELAKVAGTGASVGVVATLVYDASRTALSILDPSPYNPFEAIRMFGRGVLPGDADAATVLGVGFAVHLVNGSTFGVIYAMFARDRIRTLRAALGSGIAWGLALEGIQSILYPGWLGITTVIREFLLISAAGHVVYGATLGIGARGILGGSQPIPAGGVSR